MTDSLLPSALAAPLFSSAAMRAILDDRSRLQRMLDFEAALARAEAAVGVIPASAAGDIAAACRAERYDLAALGEAAIAAGSIDIPLVAALTAEVGKRNPESAGYVHWGASSQDLIDTALALELRAAIDALIVDLDRAIKAFTTLAGRHRRTMTLARTFLQQALPMPFGLKLAGYAAALARSRERLRRVRREGLALQFGGAGGTLAALGEQGIEVSGRIAALIDLPHPDAPWHGHRDRLADVAAVLAILAGSCGKIAGDVALLMQSEIGEASEPTTTNRGGSTALPNQRHPVAATAALSAAAIAPGLASTILAAQVQEHERGLGGWKSEWLTFPALTLVTSGALQAVVDIAEGLEVDVERMKANLEASGGLVFAEAVSFALAAKLGRAQAQALTEELVRKAATEKRPLQQVLAADERIKAQLDAAALDRLFVPTSYQGAAQTFLDRLVASSLSRFTRRSTDAAPRVVELKPAAEPAPADAPKAEAVLPAVELPKPVVEPQPVEPVKLAAEPPPAAAEAKPEAVTEAPAAKPAAEPAVASPAAPLPPAEEPSALIEAFARVANAADQLAAKPDAEHERKPA